MLDLLDWRRRVADLYRHVRAAAGDPAACVAFRSARDELFRMHPQSALDDRQKAAFSGLTYFPFDPAYRVTAQVEPSADAGVLDVDLGDDGQFRMKRFGQVNFTVPTGTGTLTLFWIMGYGGGVFLPFGDATNRHTTYGAGRYLYDTIKGADLGTGLTEIVLDFNYAYNPSCSYNPRWVCPLAPPENRLAFPVPAGEMLYEG